jgi:hypothetical protein
MDVECRCVLQDAHLLADPVCHFGVTVPYTDDQDAAEKVQIPHAVLSIQILTLPSLKHERFFIIRRDTGKDIVLLLLQGFLVAHYTPSNSKDS